MTKSKGPGYGWRWLREGEARQKGDKTLGADGTWYFVTMHRVVSDNEYVARPIEPGEGYRLLGWKEALNSKHVEVTTDGFHWDVWQYGDRWDGDEPFIYVGELANHFKWLAARVPVEQPGHSEPIKDENAVQAQFNEECKWLGQNADAYAAGLAQGIQEGKEIARDQALEEAAQVCDEDATFWEQTIEEKPYAKHRHEFRIRMDRAKVHADGIRKLKQGGQNAAISDETG